MWYKVNKEKQIQQNPNRYSADGNGHWIFALLSLLSFLAEDEMHDTYRVVIILIHHSIV